MLMGAASAASLFKQLLLATFLERSEFGIIAALTTAGVFASTLISYGSIEATRKKFPRLWTDGATHRIIEDLSEISKLVLKRAIAVFLLMASVLLIGGWRIDYGLVVVSVAFSGCIVGLCASVQRVALSKNQLAQMVILRTMIVTILPVAIASRFDFHLVLLAESISALAAALWVYKNTQRLCKAHGETIASVIPVETSSLPSLPSRYDYLFWAFLLGSIPFTLDRTVIALQLGAAEAGSYAVVSMLIVISATVNGIVEQVVGPRIVSVRHVSAQDSTAERLLWRTLWQTGAACAFIVAAAFVLIQSPLAGHLSQKYEISVYLFIPVLLVCIAQFSPILDWYLLSLDKERAIMIAAVTFFLLFVLGFGVSSALEAELVVFVWCLVVARVAQVCVQIFYINQARKREEHSLA